MSCFRLHSRSGVPRAPRKYFVVTMFAALMLQLSGNSTPCCSKLIEPSRQLVMTTSRRSQATSSKGCTPSVVHTRSTWSPVGVLRLLARADPPDAAPTLSVILGPPRSLLPISDPALVQFRSSPRPAAALRIGSVSNAHTTVRVTPPRACLGRHFDSAWFPAHRRRPRGVSAHV